MKLLTLIAMSALGLFGQGGIMDPLLGDLRKKDASSSTGGSGCSSLVAGTAGYVCAQQGTTTTPLADTAIFQSGTTGNGELSEDGAAFSRVCTAANAVCAGGGGGIGVGTFADRAALTPAAGDRFYVTDCLTSACAVGGGSIKALSIYTGAAWARLLDTSTGQVAVPNGSISSPGLTAPGALTSGFSFPDNTYAVWLLNGIAEVVLSHTQYRLPANSCFAWDSGNGNNSGMDTSICRNSAGVPGIASSPICTPGNGQCNVATPVPTPGTSVTLTAPRGYAFCTGTCTVSVPVPAAGYEFCILNDDNVSTAITLSALGSSAMYENTARTAYGTAGTGTLVATAAAGNKVCLIGRDATHYLVGSFQGTWTAN